MDSESLVLVHTSCSDRAHAERLARDLVESRLAACASIGAQVTSIYPWEGRIEREQEVTLTLKTTAAAFSDLRRRLIERHGYEVPEVLATPVIDGNHEYINWVREWVTAGKQE
ncbi:MAG: divalent-cation tolerance protein CutA [Xanthomonadaceae bacterium]|nr:divalent-cation tolerance protein CutA [Xanthomonadaceae bacterium]